MHSTNGKCQLYSGPSLTSTVSTLVFLVYVLEAAEEPQEVTEDVIVQFMATDNAVPAPPGLFSAREYTVCGFMFVVYAIIV